ncbi:folate transporter 1-like [Metopolophium dirhodum]|uniref:folate transporter 1-like n=1 Tax=Metopolophium dirhodum TaxID=44670 RepID=UPI00298F9D19|nr:folate transporter 1-like [Metopolophium dirhodum]
MDTQENWKNVSLLVCVFAMIREIRPIKPFITSYLKSMNFTLNQINEEIYAVGTYSCLVLAIIVFLITDYFRYKPLIIADGIAGIVTYVLLLGTPSLFRVQIGQIFFGFFYASEVAFTTYLYAKVDNKQLYQKITSIVKASILFGRFLSGLIAQIIVSTNLLEEVYLLYISILSTLFVTIWAFFLPKVEYSLYFHTKKEFTENIKLHQSNNEVAIHENAANDVPTISKLIKIKKVKQMIFDDFQSAYTNTYVVKKCFWWIFAFVGHFIVGLFIQVLWDDANNNKKYLMNGAVESIHTLCGAAGAYAVGHLHHDWKKFGDIIFTVGTFVLALLLFIIYFCNTLWILYLVYIIFGTCFQVLLTITTSEVAKHIKPDSYGLIFGFNLFMSLLIISIYTLLFIQGLIVVIGTKNQILSVSLMFASMSALLFIAAVWKFAKSVK